MWKVESLKMHELAYYIGKGKKARTDGIVLVRIMEVSDGNYVISAKWNKELRAMSLVNKDIVDKTICSFKKGGGLFEKYIDAYRHLTFVVTNYVKSAKKQLRNIESNLEDYLIDPCVGLNEISVCDIKIAYDKDDDMFYIVGNKEIRATEPVQCYAKYKCINPDS